METLKATARADGATWATTFKQIPPHRAHDRLLESGQNQPYRTKASNVSPSCTRRYALEFAAGAAALPLSQQHACCRDGSGGHTAESPEPEPGAAGIGT